MANLPTSPVIAPADPNIEGPNSGMNAGSSDSVIGICTDIPNPKENDWDRSVKGGTVNPIGNLKGFQYAVEYAANVFEGSPVGFAAADTQAAPGEVYATNAGGSGWNLTNKTENYTTEVGDWLWGVVSGSAEPTCKVYSCDSFITALSAVSTNLWPCNDALGSNSVVDTVGVLDLTFVNELRAFEQPTIFPGTCPGVTSLYMEGSTRAVNSNFSSVTTTTGSVGGFVRYIDEPTANTFVRIDFDLGAGGTSYIHADVFANWVSVTIGTSGAGSGNEQLLSFASLRDFVGHFIIVNYDLGSDGSYNVEVISDMVNIGTHTGTMGGGFAIAGVPDITFNWQSGATSDYQMLYYKNAMFTLEELSVLSDEYDRNNPAYIDPNPNCIPP